MPSLRLEDLRGRLKVQCLESSASLHLTSHRDRYESVKMVEGRGVSESSLGCWVQGSVGFAWLAFIKPPGCETPGLGQKCQDHSGARPSLLKFREVLRKETSIAGALRTQTGRSAPSQGTESSFSSQPVQV